MDICMNYEVTISMLMYLGDEKFFKVFKETYSELNLYIMTWNWIKSEDYPLKIYGEEDLIVRWN